MSAIFRFGNFLVLPFWALVILLPRWRGTARLMRSPWVTGAPAALYATLVLPRLGAIWPVVSRPTLTGVATLLSSPAGATIAWAHFLAFDLFVGRWIYLDSQERRISAWLTAPILFLTLMLGPGGFLFYLIARPAAGIERETSSPTRRSPKEEQEQAFSEASAKMSFAHRAGSLLRRSTGISRPLTILGVAMILTFLATLAGVLLDHRAITGAPAWLKPAKFAISIAIYCFTFVWLLDFVENHPRLVRLMAHVTVASLVVEMAVIVAQAARGTTSHFNMTTPWNTFLWTAMGTFIVFVWAMNLLLATLLVRQRMLDPAFAWSLRLGLFISLIGMATAFLMVIPTSQQMAAIAAGHGPKIIGAHSVGVADGGPGLPIVGWSTVGGDLRVAHFVGLHGLQVLPFVGWLLTRRRGVFARFGPGHRLALVWTAGLTYLGIILLLTWQALRGQSVVHPDTVTMTAAGFLVSLAAISIVITITNAWRKKEELCRHNSQAAVFIQQ